MHDADFIVGLKNGDQDVFKKLVEQHQVPLVRLCKGFLHDEEDARDIVQETFIEVFESIHHFRQDARLSTWLYRIAVNKSLNLLRKKKINRLLVSLDVFSAKETNDVEYGTTGPGQNLPGDKLEKNEKMKQIRKAVDSLPGNQRIVFILNKYMDLTNKEVAEVMDISLSAVESLMHRAKMNLQKKLFNLYKKNLI
jgi:RNA polymerase sigma-70 factor (ECF subfamily)